MLEDFKLKVFLKVAETGSFTVTAKEFGITQPSVSHNIGMLEKQLGKRLFIREKKEVVLTPEGKAFKEYAEHLTYWYDAVDCMFSAGGRLSVNRPIRIAADRPVCDYLVSKAVSRMYVSNPKLGFEIVSTGWGDSSASDVEITVAPSPTTMDFEWESRILGVMDAAVVSSPMNRSVAHAAVADTDTRTTAKPFSTLAGIHISNKFAVWSDYYELLSLDLKGRVALVSSSIETIKAAVQSSDRLIGILPEISLRDDLARRTLLKMPVSLPEFSFDIHYNPLPDFSQRKICGMLLRTLKDILG